MLITVDRKFPPRPLEATFGDLFEEVVRACQKLPDFNLLHTAEAPVSVTLGGAAECDQWDVRKDALGFHAVASGLRYDTDEDCIDGVNGWYDVNEKNEAVVNIDAAVELYCQQDEEDDDSFWISMIVTPVHEIMHVAEFLDRSRGRTPVEVFDEDGGEYGLRTILDLDDCGTEDRVESLSLRIAERLYAGMPGVRAKVEAIRTVARAEHRSRAVSI